MYCKYSHTRKLRIVRAFKKRLTVQPVSEESVWGDDSAILP